MVDFFAAPDRSDLLQGAIVALLLLAVRWCWGMLKDLKKYSKKAPLRKMVFITRDAFDVTIRQAK